jgi:hypothetical protein
MKHEIDAYFEPDLSWLGEINLQTLRLEREAGVFPPQRTRLDCALWRGDRRPRGRHAERRRLEDFVRAKRKT